MEQRQASGYWSIWLVGFLMLLWSALAAFTYVMATGGQLVQLGMSDAQAAWFESMPGWANVSWAVAVWAAFFGSILLLLRSRWAILAFFLSLLGLIGLTFFEYNSANLPADLRSPAMMIVRWGIAIFVLVFSIRCRARGLLR